MADPLCLSFRPLLALLIAFRECDVFFFGTASSHGGKSSRSEGNEGMAQVNGFGEARKAGTKAAAREMRKSGSLVAAESHIRD